MIEWEKFEKNGAEGIYSRDFNWPGIDRHYFKKIKEFMVKPDGVFPNHVDEYDHLILVESGSGILCLDGEGQELRTGYIIAVRAGQIHGYSNVSDSEDLMLIVFNTRPRQPHIRRKPEIKSIERLFEYGHAQRSI